MLHLAVDVGGTFTDICLFDDRESATRVAKVSSTRDPIDAVFEGIGEMDIALGEISLFSHGTTVATNALITRSFPRAAMVTTRGFRDVTEIRRGTKQDLWDAYEDVAPPYIRRRDRFEVAERVDYAGEELEPVNEDDVRRTAHLIERRGIETVAVCLVNAHVNPEHENKVKEILQEELPDVAISTSSEISQRSSSTSASRQRSPTPCSPRSSAITPGPSPSACEKAGTKVTCSSCTRAVAS
jgi:N-methylhydantoinase A